MEELLATVSLLPNRLLLVMVTAVLLSLLRDRLLVLLATPPGAFC